MKRTILTLLIALAIVACSKEDIKKMEGKVDVTLYLKDAKGRALKNWTVYAYDQWAWEHKGGSNPTFHAKLAATDDEGKAIFTLSVDKFENQQSRYPQIKGQRPYYIAVVGFRGQVSGVRCPPSSFTQ